jgi:hypothetical protein
MLAIDLATCSRCTGSLANLEQAIATLQPVLASIGTAVEFHKILVESEAQAQQLRLMSSPTSRVNGQDVSLETTESRCGDCSDISGSQGGTACRTWSYQGESYTEAPVGMIVDAILRALYQAETPTSVVSTPDSAAPTAVPHNLKEFFQAKAGRKANPTGCCGTPQPVATGCGCA